MTARKSIDSPAETGIFAGLACAGARKNRVETLSQFAPFRAGSIRSGFFAGRGDLFTMSEEKNYVLEFSPFGEYPFHIQPMESSMKCFLCDAFERKNHDWRIVAWGLTHDEASDLANEISAYWEKNGIDPSEEVSHQ